MTRIFLTLALLSTLLLIAAYVLGLNIDDPKIRSQAAQSSVAYHFLTALAALVFATLVHTIVLTYFIGTRRWMEETRLAYDLAERFQAESQSLKYRCFPGMVGCLLLLIATGALGAAADPASPVGFQGWGGFSAATIHLLCASTSICLNVLVYVQEYRTVDRNGRLISEVLAEIRRIREQLGLPA